MKLNLRLFALLAISFSHALASSETVLWAFNPGHGDPTFPYENALSSDNSGNLYGVTASGGAYNGGAAFKLTPNANGSWTKTVFYSFPNDGSTSLIGGLAVSAEGNVYGVSSQGGANDTGYVYELSRTTAGAWARTIIHTFGKCCSEGPDGTSPFAGVIVDPQGRLYGTTSGGGPTGYGIVYELAASKNDTWSETVIHSFNYFQEGGYPFSPLLLDPSGNLYGTNAQGGLINYECPVGCGSVFKLARSGSSWTFDLLHLFDGVDGQYPRYSGVIMDKAGNLYGTTESGGIIEGGAYGVGTVWELVASRSPNVYNIQVLHNFPTGGSVDGVDLLAGVTMDSKGNLFGTTFEGGTYNQPYGGGIVFELTKGSNNQWNETILHEFTTEADGGNPSGGVVVMNGKVFGMTECGGLYPCTAYNSSGVVFEITP